MDLDRLNRWLSLAANIGVLAGIALLVVEVRQNNANLNAQARAIYHTNFADVWGMAALEPGLAEVLSKELLREPLTRPEAIQLAAYFTKDLLANQLSYLELPAEESAGNLHYLRGSFDNFPLYRGVWEHRQDFFNPAFVEYVNQNIVDQLADKSTIWIPRE